MENVIFLLCVFIFFFPCLVFSCLKSWNKRRRSRAQTFIVFFVSFYLSYDNQVILHERIWLMISQITHSLSPYARDISISVFSSFFFVAFLECAPNRKAKAQNIYVLVLNETVIKINKKIFLHFYAKAFSKLKSHPRKA